MVLPNKITFPLVDDPEIQQALLYQPPMVILSRLICKIEIQQAPLCE